MSAKEILSGNGESVLRPSDDSLLCDAVLTHQRAVFR